MNTVRLGAAAFLLTSLASGVLGQTTPSGHQKIRWKLLYEENFTSPIKENSAPWVRDSLGPQSPWYVGPLGDDGAFFHDMGGLEFAKQIKSFSIYRKRVVFGQDGWLTLELAARDPGNKGRPAHPPSFSIGRVGGRPVGIFSEPDFEDGILLRDSKPLPPVYRIECRLVQVDFGGSRGGSWRYDGRFNGYGTDYPRTSYPWPWGPDPIFSQPYNRWPDVTGANGFYYLTIVDYPAAPHNNVFIHTHRKVNIDSYNTPSAAFDTCNPAARRFYRSSDGTVNAFFAIPGTDLETKAEMKTECGAVYGGENGRTAYVGAVQLVPEMLPKRPYRFAIERDDSGYTIELSGFFRFAGQKTYRYHRQFIEDGRPIWHYNQTPKGYDGSFNQTWVYQGPFGRFTAQSWPKGSSYPDYFIIGDPHLNFYEGTAAIADVRLYVPAPSGDKPGAGR